MFVEHEHPVAGKLKIPGSHLKLSETPATIRTPAPALGQDNQAVYGGLLGLTSEEIASLRDEGVL